MIEGWKCPGCGACFAPFVKKCDTCIGTSITINPINPVIQMPTKPYWYVCPSCEVPYHREHANTCGTQQVPPTTTFESENFLGHCLSCGAPYWSDHASTCGRNN